MRFRTILFLVGTVWTAIGGALAIGVAVELWRGEPWAPFALAVAVALGGGAGMVLPTLRDDHALDHRSAFLVVALGWLSACALGAIPFATYPGIALSPVDALFESASGFTTTGATVMSNIDSLPRSLLIWRSITQWLGGMGILVFGVAILPMLGVGGMALYRAEAPGLTKDKITPRIAETAKLLWVLYAALTAAAMLAYRLAGMSWFDAACHAMTTLSTGGFSTHDASFAYFDSGAIDAIATLFMLAGGTSFAVLYRSLTHGLVWRDQPELRAYLFVFAVAVLVIAVDLSSLQGDSYASGGASLRHAAFQVASILTTTGFATQDFDAWPELSRTLLFGLFFVGGMAGSTAGGIKVVRVVLLLRIALSQVFYLVHPRGVNVIRLGRRTVDDRIVTSVVSFMVMWLALLAVGTAVITLFEADLFSSLCAAAVTLGNIGPGLGDVGPTHTFAQFAPSAKLVMVALMVFGRLEIYTLLVILTPEFWRR